MLVHMFPGQGSQHAGMGGQLFDSVPEFAEWEERIDGLLGYSLRDMCLRNPDNLLASTQYTQPCVFVVNALHHLSRLRADGRKPDVVVGHSLGEYDALWAAGVLDFFDGLQLVKKRGELMGRARGGGMAAVIGLDARVVEDVLRSSDLESLTIANRNTPRQLVLSGPVTDIERAGKAMEKAGARAFIPLQVSAAFHSAYMFEAHEVFALFLERFEFRTASCTVVSNVTARPYPAPASSEQVRSLLAQQMMKPVLWTDSIAHLLDAGATEFVEVGPGKVLSKMATEIRAAVAPPVARAV